MPGRRPGEGLIYLGRYMLRVTFTPVRSPVVARRSASRLSSGVLAVGWRVIAAISSGVNRMSLPFWCFIELIVDGADRGNRCGRMSFGGPEGL